ncbi:MAG: hypothetical protein AAGJ83_02525, partial [Planctomycetota bacterium]
TSRRSDGKLAACLTIVQTRPRTGRVRLEFCVFAEAAFRIDSAGLDRVLDELPEDVTCEDGAVHCQLAAHEAATLVVVFDV